MSRVPGLVETRWVYGTVMLPRARVKEGKGRTVSLWRKQADCLIQTTIVRVIPAEKVIIHQWLLNFQLYIDYRCYRDLFYTSLNSPF